MGFHSQQTANHRLESFVYATSVARLAASGFTSDDVGKIAYQTDLQVYYRLDSVTPNSWVQIAGSASSDGWISADTDGWTYASATTFTITGDFSVLYDNGDKIKLTQTTVKYFYIVGVSYSAPTTTITVTAGDDYTLANAAITNAFFSKQQTPDAFPQYFNYTPTYTGFSAAPSGGVRQFIIQGKMCIFNHYPANDGTSNATNFFISIPVTSAAGQLGNSVMSTRIRNAGANFTFSIVETAGAATTATVFSDVSGGQNFTASGGKNMRGYIIYQI